MNFTDIINQIEAQLKDIQAQERSNQEEQAQVTQRIEELKLGIETMCHRQSELDQEALELCRLGEELKEKKRKIARIQSFSSDFQDLQAEFQGNQDLLDTLYSSISAVAVPDPNFDPNTPVTNSPETQPQNNVRPEQLESEELELSIATIKSQLPHAERLYQKLVAKHLEQYHTYQNLIVNGLDLIWCSVAFAVFGKEAYRKMSLRYHPDQNGSDLAMQLINTAWEISQQHLESGEGY